MSVREPLLQFLVIGAALFAGYYAFGNVSGPSQQRGRIELTADDLRQMTIAWVAQGRPAPSAEEMARLVEARVREEILYREALSLGLDKDDAIVKRRLAQKMGFLFEDVAALGEPTSDELRQWFAQHAARFALPARATFVHRYFSPDRRGAGARADAAAALQALAGQAADAPAAAALADPFMFHDYYGDRSYDELVRAFGPAFVQQLFEVAPGAWRGPIESGYGWHLVFVDSITPSRVPAFEDVASEVQAAWIEEHREEIRERAFDAMRARYAVVLPQDFDPQDVAPRALAAASAPAGSAQP
jgi:hypothetical protein